VVVLSTPQSITVKSGENFALNATPSYDPDGDGLSFLWFQYKEAGTYDKLIPFSGMTNMPFLPHIKAPDVTKAATIHFIVCVTDKGMPRLTRYKRVIVTVVPK